VKDCGKEDRKKKDVRFRKREEGREDRGEKRTASDLILELSD
jgi:hypothetical protein